MYASLLISLLAAFIAMLGKQWLNRYLRNAGGSMIERCGDRQLKYDGLKKWPFHLFIESLPVMLQIALFLLACGLCKHMASVNTSVAVVLITLTALGVLFYLGVTIAGTVSYECPFQTPVSTALCSLWERIGPQITTALLPIIATGASLFEHLPWPLVMATLHQVWGVIPWPLVMAALYQVWGVILCQVLHVLLWLPQIGRQHHSQSVSLPIVQHNPQENRLRLASLHSMWESIQCKIFCLALHLPQIPPLQTIQEGSPTTSVTSPWLTPMGLATLQKTNAHDVLCVSWILWNITDREALDAAIRLAGTIRWFEDGVNAEPPYDLIISSLKMCFDSTGKLYPGSRDRAYSSAQATLWIHVCAMRVSKEFALRFPLPAIHCNTTSLDADLEDLLKIYTNTPDLPNWMYDTLPPKYTPVYTQWTANALLHLSWAKQGVPGAFDGIGVGRELLKWDTIPENIVLNHLLVSCIFLGWPVDKEVLIIQDKSYVISSSLFTICSHHHLLAATWNELCLNFLRQWFQPSMLPSLNVNSSHLCFLI